MIFQKNSEKVFEEDIFIQAYGKKISKELKVFYNPVMKLNRDISLLVIANYFEKPIKFCDPMAASGIRELRFIRTIPTKFSELVVGDISKTAIKNIRKNFRANKLPTKKLTLQNQDANATISSAYFDFIEIDPFGSPVPFLDSAVQKIKHNGVLSVTATDTAALCGTYPRTTLRRYGIKVEKTLWHEELGLRNLIAYCQRQAAKYEKVLTPILSYTNQHYYKVFFKVDQSRTKAVETLKKLQWIQWDKKTQEVTIEEYESKESFGKTYTGKLCDKGFIQKLLDNIELIEASSELARLLTSLRDELDTIGYYNPHKFCKEYGFECQKKFYQIIEDIKEKGYEISRPHNNRLGIKTNCPAEEFIKIMKD